MTFRLSVIGITIAVISYLLGSVSFAVIITNFFSKKDIRNIGSGNAGATNVLRSVGWLPGLLTILGDTLKVSVAIFFARFLLHADLYFGLRVLGSYWAGFFCVLGHLYPIFFRFKGGKGVMTCAGMILFIDWRIFLILLGVFIIVLLLTRFVSLASMICAAGFPIATYFMYIEIPPEAKELTRLLTFFYNDQRGFVTLIAALFAIIIILKHHSNILRLLKGTESKISFIKQKEPDRNL